MNFRLLKAFWGTLKDDFKKMVDEFHSRGVWPRGANASSVALIPKTNDPQSLSEFRPIPLIGCMYKVVSKILANRIKEVLPSLNDERQFAFVGGRNILDSIQIG